MLTQSDIPNLMNPAIKATFFEAYDAALQASGDWQQICTVVPSTTDTESYGWLGALASMAEWKDERKPQSLSEFSYSLKNVPYEATIGVDKDALADDQFGQIKLRIQGLAQEAARYKESLVMNALESAITALAYDGVAVCANNRTAIGDSGAIDNLDTGTALTAANLEAAIIKMMAYKDDRGKLMGIVPDTLVVSPTKAMEAAMILGSTYQAEVANTNQYRQFASNPFMLIPQGKLKLIVTPYISTTAARWFLLDTKRMPKPVILQMRKDIAFEALEGNTEAAFMRKKLYYGVDMRCAIGYGLPQTIYTATA